MRTLFYVFLVLILLTAVSALIYVPTAMYLKYRNSPDWRLADVVRGDTVEVVNATGTIKPVLSVHIGSFVSGPIQQLFVDFNQEVKKGDPLAKIDPTIYQASVARDRAAVASRKADVD